MKNQFRKHILQSVQSKHSYLAFVVCYKNCSFYNFCRCICVLL